MLETKHLKLTRSADEAFAEIGADVWTGPLADALKEPLIVCLRAVSKSFRAMMRSMRPRVPVVWRVVWTIPARLVCRLSLL